MRHSHNRKQHLHVSTVHVYMYMYTVRSCTHTCSSELCTSITYVHVHAQCMYYAETKSLFYELSTRKALSFLELSESFLSHIFLQLNHNSLHLVMFRSCNSCHIELFHHVIVLPPLCRCRVQEGREAQMASTMWALQEGREEGREGRRKEGRDEE